MSKYLARGPYHYIDFANKSSVYHEHVTELLKEIESLHLDAKSSIFEVGCGEGLILQMIQWRFDYTASGCDADPRAVEMGRLISKGVYISLGDNCPMNGIFHYDAILFADSLEHIENWREHLAWAQECSPCVIIAVPDKHDPHGLRDFKLDSFDEIFSGWRNPVRKQRASRFVTAWQR